MRALRATLLTAACLAAGAGCTRTPPVDDGRERGADHGAPMSPRDQVLHTFHAFVATQLKLSPRATDVFPEPDVTSGKDVDPNPVFGAALPVLGGKVGSGGELVQPVLKGWATPDAAITLQHDFGALLEQAGLWSGKPSADLERLPSALVWALNDSRAIGSYQPGGSPVVKLAADGSGTVTIPLRYQEGGHGGYVSPMVEVDVLVTVSKDHRATVSVPDPWAHR